MVISRTSAHNPRGPRHSVQAVPRLKAEPGSGPLRILADVHRYPPEHNAGAEWMLHDILRHLVERGHCCRVMADVTPGVLDGVEIGPFAVHHYGHADVVITHLDRTRQSIRWASSHGKPLVHLLHNDAQLRFHKVDPAEASAVVANSEWLRRSYAWWGGDVDLCRPPLSVEQYRVPLAGASGSVVMVNLLAAKGAATLYNVAQRLSRRSFLGVRGAYGYQTSPAKPLSNLEIIDQTPRIAEEVYSRASVVMMPSHYESWGRVAVEACCSGIPVVAAPTPGLLESLGDAGIFVAHQDFGGWAREVEHLLSDPEHYAERSAAARRRAESLDLQTRLDLAAFERLLLRAVA